jgi:hypothetical protein
LTIEPCVWTPYARGKRKIVSSHVTRLVDFDWIFCERYPQEIHPEYEAFNETSGEFLRRRYAQRSRGTKDVFACVDIRRRRPLGSQIGKGHTRTGRCESTRGPRHDEAVIPEELRSEWITLNAEEYNRILRTGEKIFNLLADVESRSTKA